MRRALPVFLLALSAACASSSTRLQDDPFERATADRPPSAQTLHAMARLLAAQGRDDECEWALHRLISEDPDFAPAYNDLAELHLRHGRTAEAAASLEAGLARAPLDPVLLNNLGMCELQRGAHARALERFTQAVAASPGDARCRANLALALGLLGRLEEARALYLQVIPPADAHHNLAIVCEARGDARAAERERALEAQLRSRGAP
ncbi:MAG TPA: tetratricopeptide repeat protein [Planctomycetota bacterium]|nr:tetratricopeptide repeat protein [Planctomycetota bacterium]